MLELFFFKEDKSRIIDGFDFYQVLFFLIFFQVDELEGIFLLLQYNKLFDTESIKLESFEITINVFIILDLRKMGFQVEELLIFVFFLVVYSRM